MYRILLTFLCLHLAIALSAQTVGVSTGSKAPLPAVSNDWKFGSAPGFTAVRDVPDAPSALRITAADTVTRRFFSFTQDIAIHPDKATRMTLNAYIKTQDVRYNVALWCQIRDENNKMIGFENTEMQQLKISGTSDWKKYSLTLVVDRAARKLVVGGFLRGAGTALFDRFDLEYISAPPAVATRATAFARELTATVKNNSIYADALNWGELDQDMAELAVSIRNEDELNVLSDYIVRKLRSAGDNHSFVQPKVVAQQYAATNLSPKKPEGKLLPDSTAYLSVPAFLSTSDTSATAFASRLQQLIRDLDQDNKANRWIVDLRTNGGGNMWPMLAGLAPLTGSAKSGYFIRMANGKEQKTGWNPAHVRVNKPYKLRNKNPKIAVLIGPGTGSSGEMTAIAFAGKGNTKLFGQPSSGYITANGSYPLSNGSVFLLASSYAADRTGKIYKKQIIPDVAVAPEKGQDTGISAALAWLHSSGN